MSKQNLARRTKSYRSNAAFNKGRKYFDHFYDLEAEPPLKTWFHKWLPRIVITTITRIKSNHYNLNYSLHRKNMIDSPAYNCGESIQDLNHVVFYCQLTKPHSKPLLQYLSKEFSSCPLDTILEKIISKTPKLCRLITAFLKCNLSI